MIKEIPAMIAGLVHHLYNLMIANEEFPEALNTGQVIPIFKEGKDSMLSWSYRPIFNFNTIEVILKELPHVTLDR